MSKEKYSFSRLDLFSTCKRAWKFRYVDNLKGIENAFAQHGTLIHEILEKYANGEYANNKDMIIEFLDRFDKEVTCDYPVFSAKINLREHYKDKYSEFLAGMKGFSGSTVVTELPFEKDFILDDGSSVTYRGYIDLITECDEYVSVIDFKSGNKFTKKELAKKKRQLLLYYPIVRDMYPDKKIRLFFYFVKKGEVVEVSVDDIGDAIQFMKDAVKEINEEKDFDYGLTDETIKEMSFFCVNICQFRDDCEARKNIIKPNTWRARDGDISIDKSNVTSRNISLSKR